MISVPFLLEQWDWLRIDGNRTYLLIIKLIVLMLLVLRGLASGCVLPLYVAAKLAQGRNTSWAPAEPPLGTVKLVSYSRLLSRSLAGSTSLRLSVYSLPSDSATETSSPS